MTEHKRTNKIDFWWHWERSASLFIMVATALYIFGVNAKIRTMTVSPLLHLCFQVLFLLALVLGISPYPRYLIILYDSTSSRFVLARVYLGVRIMWTAFLAFLIWLGLFAWPMLALQWIVSSVLGTIDAITVLVLWGAIALGAAVAAVEFISGYPLSRVGRTMRAAKSRPHAK